MTYVDFLTPAIREASAATEADNQKDYEKALDLYKKAINRFMIAIKHEKKSPERKAMLTDKVKDLLNRAEKIKKYVDEGGSSTRMQTGPGRRRRGGWKEEEGEEDEEDDEEEEDIDVPTPNPISEFTNACCYGDIAKIKRYLGKHNFDVSDEDYEYGLHYAAYHNKLLACQILIQSGEFDIKKICNYATVTQYTKDWITRSALRVNQFLHDGLQKIVGLDKVKESLYKMANKIILDDKREIRGMDVAMKSRDIILKGNPGTGKTTIASLICKMYHAFGITRKRNLKEVEKGDFLVAGSVGKTALKTREVIEGQEGGVLLVNEVYRLSQQGDFGRKALEEITKAVSGDSKIIFIFSGPEKEMEEFFRAKETLFRRTEYEMNFPDFSCEEIAEILKMEIDESDYKLDWEIDTRWLACLIDETPKDIRSKMNAEMARKLKEYAIDELNKGLSLDAEGDELYTIKKIHLQKAMENHFLRL